MSAFSRSERRGSHAALIAALLATLLVLLFASGAHGARRRAAAPDSGSTVRTIRVSDRGILVDGEATRDSISDSRGGSWSSRDGWRSKRVRARMRDGGLIQIEDSGTGIVRIWSDAYVPAGQVVDGDVVAVFGSVTVEGTVTNDVVAVFGSVHLKDGARVDGQVVTVGGVLDQGEGSTIKGESVQLGFTPITWGLPARSVLIFAIVCGWLVSLFTGWLFVLIFGGGMLRVATVAERRPAASFFVGLLSVPLFLVTLVLLCITVIGIPLAILLPMLYMLMGYAGQLAASAVLGARLARRPLAEGLMVPLIVGTLFVAALAIVGVALMTAGPGIAHPLSLFLVLSGIVLLIGLGALGTGAFLLSRFGTRPRDVVPSRWTSPAGASVMPGAVPPPATG
jgi:hypothetical protein